MGATTFRSSKQWPPQLYGITDQQLMPGQQLFDKVDAALAGGCGWLQYRDKSNDQQKRLREAKRLLELCQHHGAALIINDDVKLAADIRAHGVHLGQDDANPQEARQQLGDHAIIGVTCHADLELARQAQRDGADYVAFGRFYSSGTKPGASSAPLALLGQARESIALPIVAIGGIAMSNATEVLAAGAHTLAICGGLFGCDDPRARAQLFCQLQIPG